MSTKIFDKYEVIRRLAVGGMGEIFLCRQSGVAGFDRLVILKTLLPDLARDTEAVGAFLDEARVAATLNHPNIVGIHEVGCWQGVYFIAMEYIEGESISGLLHASLSTDVPIAYTVSAKIAQQAALGLDHAHRARGLDGEPLNIIHRDVSPQNIMVRADGVAKVVDFGIARASNRATRTSTGLVKGKLGYMPPEQVTGAGVDPRSDQWALGAVLWEMCARRRLLDPSLDQLRRIQKLVNEDPVPPSDHAPDIPPELDAIVMRMLSREPDRRFASCGEAANVLRDAVGQLGVDAADHSDIASVVATLAGEAIEGRVTDLTPSGEDFLVSLSDAHRTEELSFGGRRRPMVAVIAAFVLFVAAGLGVAAYLRGGSAAVDEPIEETNETVAIVISKPLGATVLIDGESWPDPVPTTVTGLEPGKHEIRLRVVGRPDIVLEKRAEHGQRIVIHDSEVTREPPVLALTSTPSGATVRAGTFVLGTTPLEIDSLAPGTRQVLSIELAGYQPQKLTVTLEPGEQRTEKVRLERRKRAKRRNETSAPAAPVALEDCLVTLDSKPWTKIEVDGEPKGPSPVFRLRLRPGRHQVRFVNEAKKIDETRTVSCKSGEKLKRTFTFD